MVIRLRRDCDFYKYHIYLHNIFFNHLSNTLNYHNFQSKFIQQNANLQTNMKINAGNISFAFSDRRCLLTKRAHIRKRNQICNQIVNFGKLSHRYMQMFVKDLPFCGYVEFTQWVVNACNR